MLYLGARFLSLFNVLGKLGEGTVMTFFVVIGGIPLHVGLASEAALVDFGRVVGLALEMVGGVVRGECLGRIIVSVEGLEDLGLVVHLVLPLNVPLIIVGIALVLRAAEEMANSGVAEAPLHIIGGDILQAYFDITLLISGIIFLVFELLHVLEL